MVGNNNKQLQSGRHFAVRLIIAAALAAVVAGCGGAASTNSAAPPVDPGSTPPSPSPTGNVPTVSLTANPTSVATGASTTLSWSSTNASDCSASGAWSGSKGISGSESVGPISTPSTYTLTCRGSGGSASRSVTVTVPPPLGSTIATVNVEEVSGASDSGIPITFGHVFRTGDVPAGATLTARTAGGSSVSIPLQVDRKTAHPDGSLRFAVMTAVVPSLAASERASIELVSTASGAAGTAVRASDLLATSFDASVSLDVGGTPYSVSARDLLSDASPTWLAGPLVSEWMVAGPVRTAGGAAHPSLTVRFHIRAYAGLSRVRVDVTVENAQVTASNPDLPANITYNASVRIGGTEVYTLANFAHYHHARWRKLFWWGSGGAPNVHVAHDKSYLMATGAVPNYDQTLAITDAALQNEASAWAAAPKGPGAIGVLNPYMPNVGGRAEIGHLPRFAARYLLTMDRPAARTKPLKDSIVGHGDLAGSWPIHLRDAATDLPIQITVAGGNLWWTGGTSGTPLTPDIAHQPSLAYLPYLLTGDYYYLEEMQFWATWNWVSTSPSLRNGAAGVFTRLETRGHAWALRNLGHAAYATPDNHPLKSYFVQRVNNVLGWYNSNFTDNASASRLGWMSGYAATGQFDPTPGSWEDDFFTHSVGWLWYLGFGEEARRLLYWKSRFSVGFMTDPGYCWVFGSIYRKVVGTGGTYFTSFAEMYRPTLMNSVNMGQLGLTQQEIDDMTINNTIACGSAAMGAAVGLPAGAMVRDYWPDEYPSIMYGALAMAIDVGYPNAELAYDRLAGRTNPVQDPDGYEFNPTFAIVPRTVAKTVMP